jgi:hypothetical protein
MGIQFATGSRTPIIMCLSIVGLELRNQEQDNHQCMTMIEQEHLSDFVQPDNSKHWRLDSFEEQLQPEMRLEPGEQYGWWAEHDAGGNRNCSGPWRHQTNILLDSGALVSMLNQDLARRLKLKVKFGKELRCPDWSVSRRLSRRVLK